MKAARGVAATASRHATRRGQVRHPSMRLARAARSRRGFRSWDGCPSGTRGPYQPSRAGYRGSEMPRSSTSATPACRRIGAWHASAVQPPRNWHMTGHGHLHVRGQVTFASVCGPPGRPCWRGDAIRIRVRIRQRGRPLGAVGRHGRRHGRLSGCRGLGGRHPAASPRLGLPSRTCAPLLRAPRSTTSPQSTADARCTHYPQRAIRPRGDRRGGVRPSAVPDRTDRVSAAGSPGHEMELATT